MRRCCSCELSGFSCADAEEEEEEEAAAAEGALPAAVMCATVAARRRMTLWRTCLVTRATIAPYSAGSGGLSPSR
jgi:hypothetical protein